MSSFRSARRYIVVALACSALLGLLLGEAHAHDPNALWKIVSDQCVTHERSQGTPAPCEQVDLQPGAGFAVLKDRVGVAQYLLIPTKRISGVESLQLLTKGSPNYWAFAWGARSAVEALLHRKLPRNEIALAINSAYGRTQNQLHIHVDCICQDVLRRLRGRIPDIGPHWAPLGITLRGHPYWAMRVRGADLGDSDPFKLLARGLPQAREHMDRRTLVVVGATFAHDAKGFILLTDQVDPRAGDRASGEELLDHTCAVAGRGGGYQKPGPFERKSTPR